MRHCDYTLLNTSELRTMGPCTRNVYCVMLSTEQQPAERMRIKIYTTSVQ
jgi:hypothetical protein